MVVCSGFEQRDEHLVEQSPELSVVGFLRGIKEKLRLSTRRRVDSVCYVTSLHKNEKTTSQFEFYKTYATFITWFIVYMIG